jgi:hypothetical protein
MRMDRIFTDAQIYAVVSRLGRVVPEEIVREVMEEAGRLILQMLEGKANAEVYEQLADKRRWG